MYFEIENTPERTRRVRRTPPPPDPPEQRPVLSLAPFSRPPQVLFEYIPVGQSADRLLDVINPTKKSLQIALGRAPPPGLVICLPNGHLEVEPQESYTIQLRWTPSRPTAQRETIHFTDQNRGRYDVILILKTFVMQPIKKMSKRKSPKKIGVISPKQRISKAKLSPQYKAFTTYQTQHYVTEMLVSSSRTTVRRADKENWSPQQLASSTQKSNFCPFDSPISIKSSESFNGNMLTTSDMFTMKESHHNTFTEDVKDNRYNTYTEEVSGIKKLPNESFSMVGHQPHKQPTRGVLSTTTRYNNNVNIADAIDELTFTPLKSVPKITLQRSATNYFDAPLQFDDSLEIDKFNNKTHFIIIKSPDEKHFQPEFIAQKASNTKTYDFNMSADESSIQSKKIPNTSSPKQHESPGNFSMNTDFSRISTDSFYPQRCSTERKQILTKALHTDNFMEMVDGVEKTYPMLGSDTYSKLDSPITPMDVKLHKNYLKPPNAAAVNEQFSKSNTNPRQLTFNAQGAVSTGRKNDRNCGDGVRSILEANLWQTDKSPPRSLTPPLQSIPEESTQFSSSNFLDKSSKQCNTFTINTTYDKPRDSLSKPRDSFCKPRDSFCKPRDSFCKPKDSFSKPRDNLCKPRDSISSSKQVWQRTSVKCDTELWKLPVRPSEATSMQAIPENYTDVSSCSVYHLGDVYTQSSTVDPFLSSTYFYDEEAVDKFEKEFKRWLNYILTPPADLESNTDELKIDVGKVWIESRNKEVPAAPTKEQVSSKYHNSHRLESVRKSARTLFMSSNMTEVFMKLNAQIDKKLIAIRTDKNLHLDIGLQKIIMDLLLCYNPLWLRIGLETLYGTIIPLTSNSDIYGLSLFIVQRMFKDPYARSKHSHPHIPNMLLPSYVDYIRKFTLKKYFMLVFFLDQAKQKKLIFHDPCLFCRNAPYKESRELLIRFTRELITGIGDITKHLRPLGYIVSHKQCFLDEFKYAVYNLAIDLKDGVRLTKVMEIILVKSGLISNLRTPAISRLQKIHNVQIALNALKEANFNIVGDITAKDIADGHREKTLSLLWQIIHVFRAPLFEKAANVIQMWWKKKYLVVTIEKRIKQKHEMKRSNAAGVIQCWWRKIQYNRFVENQMKQLEAASVVVQKYWRMWIARSHYLKYRKAVHTIESWYLSTKQIQEAQQVLNMLRLRQRSSCKIQLWYHKQMVARKIVAIRDLYSDYCSGIKKKIAASNIIKRYLKRLISLRKFRNVVMSAFNADKLEKLQQKSASTIQSCVKAWLCRIKYQKLRQQVILCQSIVRGFMVRKRQKIMIERIIFIQRKFRSRILMQKQKQIFADTKHATIVLQSHFKMLKQRRYYKSLKKSVSIIESHYVAILKMRRERQEFLQLKSSTIIVQKYYRRIIARRHYVQTRQRIVSLQQIYRANVAMKIQREMFIKLKRSVTNIENHYIALVYMRKHRSHYLNLKASTIVVQKNFRAIVARKEFMQKKQAIITLQQRYRANVAMKIQRDDFKKFKQSAIIVQRYVRSCLLMKKERNNYIITRTATLTIQKHFRAYRSMKNIQGDYNKLKQTTINLQRRFRAKLRMKKERSEFLKLKIATEIIQSYYRAIKLMREQRAEFIRIKSAAVVIQTRLRAKLLMEKERQAYLQKRYAIVTIQNYYRCYTVSKIQRQKYLKLKSSTLLIQRRFRQKKLTKLTTEYYLSLRRACLTIQQRFRYNIIMKQQKHEYQKLKASTIVIQRLYRAKLLTRKCETEYKALKKACGITQARYRAILQMRKQRNSYRALKNAALIFQKYYRAKKLKEIAMAEYNNVKYSTILIQRRLRAYLTMNRQRAEYLEIRKSAIVLQRRYRARLAMKTFSLQYQQLRHCVLKVQQQFRANRLMMLNRNNYLQHKMAANKIKAWYRASKTMHRDRDHYLKVIRSVKIIERAYLAWILMVRARSEFVILRQAAVTIQQKFKATKLAQCQRQKYLTVRTNVATIQQWYRSVLRMRLDQSRFIELKENKKRCEAARKIQQWYRFTILTRETRHFYLRLKQSVIRIQSVYRMQRVKKEYADIRSSIICIQRHYRSYNLKKIERQKFHQMRNAAIKIQSFWRCWHVRQDYLKLRKSALTIQKAYRSQRFERLIKLEKRRRHEAATCIQKYFKTYSCVKRYKEYRYRVILIQRQWRRVILMRKLQNVFLAMRNAVVKLQALARGYLARRMLKEQHEALAKRRKEQKLHRAASKIQALFRGHRERTRLQGWAEVVQLRRRWNAGALLSDQETLAKRNVEALDVLTHFSDMASIIRAFLTLDLLTEVYPMIYHQTANRVALSLIEFMMNANRSVSTLDTIRSAAAIIVNLARYTNTAVTIYSRQKMGKILKLILRWSTQDSKYYRILCTFMWLFGKYDPIRKDLTEFLHEPENQKILNYIRVGVLRKQRMMEKSPRYQTLTPKNLKFQSRSNVNLNMSCRTNTEVTAPPHGLPMPVLEPDYGLVRPDKPRFFQHDLQAINSLFTMFNFPLK